MRKNKLLFLLVLLMTAATGAWADETPIATILASENSTFVSGSKTFADKVKITFSGAVDCVLNRWQVVYDSTNGNEGTVTVEGVNGTNISKVVFYDEYGSHVMTASPYTLYFYQAPERSDFIVCTGANGEGETDLSMITKIEVFGAAASAGYTVSLKDGVKDADKWTISPNPAPEGSPVTIQYTGRLKVKGVTATSDAGAPAANIVDLATLTADYEAQDGDVLTGTLAGNYKISIADGATVTLDGVTINGVNDANYEWAGITCLGDATIILSGTNTVKGFYEDYPGIQAAADKTLIINGTGSLTASSYGYGAGIGGKMNVACGNIEIQGGTITATSVNGGAGIGGGDKASCGNITISDGTVIAIGGEGGAGIGGGENASCGNITISGGTVTATGGWRGAGIGSGKRGTIGSCGNILISGGTVTATGGENAAGIGGGRGNNNKTFSSCGDITIANTVTKVTATKGENAPNSIGAGYYGNCGTVTIGGTKYWENNAAVNGGDTNLATSPLIYDPSAPAATYTLLSAATTSDYGKVVCAAGHLHEAKTAVPDGCTAVGILGKVTETGHGLILALQDATAQTWNTIDGWTSVTTYAGTTLKVLPNDAARGTNLTSYTKLGETTVSNWAVAQKSDYAAIFTNLGSATGHSSGKTYDGNVNAYITTGVGGTAISGNYWSATENEEDDAWYFGSSSWDAYPRDENQSVRPVLGF